MAIPRLGATLWLMLARTLFACICAVFALAFALAAPARAADGFGTDGRVIVDFGGGTNTVAGDIAIQPDGRIVASGWVNGSFGVVRLLPTGSLDRAFGAGGVVHAEFGSQRQDAGPPRLALQPDGKIVVAGNGYNPFPVGGRAIGDDFAVMRLNADGSLDQSFGEGGKVLLPVGQGTDVAQAVALQPDGKIVVAGYTARDPFNSDFAAIRLTPQGALDASFGSGGQAVIPMAPDSGMDAASAVAMTPAGAILVAGVTAREATGFDIAVVRLTSGGTLDPAFGADGRAEFALGTGAWQEIVRSLVVLPDGSFYVGGSALQPGFGPSQVAVARFTAAGVPDWQSLQPLGTLEDTSSGIVAHGSELYLAVDSKLGPSEREVGLLTFDASRAARSTLFHITPGGDDRVAGLAPRADRSVVELATVRAPESGNSVFGFVLVNAKPGQAPVPPPGTPVDEPPERALTATFPRPGARLHRVRVFRGTATGARRVDVALVRRAGRTCFYLNGPAPSFRVRRLRHATSKCTQLIWKRASGTSAWSYLLKRPLPAGRYALCRRSDAVAAQRSAFSVR